MDDTARGYRVRLERVLRHIDRHGDEDLDVDALAAVAAFSKFHFHRQFAAVLGITVGRYVQLVRLKRAAWRLAFRDDAVTGIALDAGYEAPEAFARAFRSRHGQSPSGFRRRPDWRPWHAAHRLLTEIRSKTMSESFTLDQVRIVERPAVPVALMSHRGDPAAIGDTIRRFIAWRRAAGLPPSRSATYNLFHGDPATVPAAEFRLDLCAATDRPIDPTHEVTAFTIPGGRAAVLRLVGGDDRLGPAFTFLYGTWLPQSGEELRDFPPFGQRIRFFPDVAEHEAVTDLFLPLR